MPSARFERTGMYLCNAQNVRCDNGHTASAVLYDRPEISRAVDWPFTQLVKTQLHLLAAGRSTLAELDASTLQPTSYLTGFQPAGRWHVADLGQTVVMNNGASSVFTEAGVWKTATNDYTSCGAHQQRLLLIGQCSCGHHSSVIVRCGRNCAVLSLRMMQSFMSKCNVGIGVFISCRTLRR